ncbi:unnamed protein product [Ixodes hexagonus]
MIEWISRPLAPMMELCRLQGIMMLTSTTSACSLCASRIFSLAAATFSLRPVIITTSELLFSGGSSTRVSVSCWMRRRVGRPLPIRCRRNCLKRTRSTRWLVACRSRQACDRCR